MQKPTVHLICNAHLDPVWLWEWEEGAAEAISTFRVAAEFCEEFDGFVFNHNEAILYEWVEEYEPELFTRIQRLVKAGKWHIMGGWYLQPDCNMPSGESFVRQILIGQRYFKEKFGVSSTTAINFDPFGHTQGLVQILAKSGYDSYLFCRPGNIDTPLPRDEFIWQGYDGSQVMATRMPGYNSHYGKATEKIENFIKGKSEFTTTTVPWGVGNHGGGPSKIDLQNIAKLIAKRDDVRIIHSTPEKYFAELSHERTDLPVRDDDLNPWAVGCYTSQIRLKQKHRKLENELYKTEKMLANIWIQGIMEYPTEKLDEAMRDLCHAEFHDILPGSSIQPVEDTSLRLMDHGLEILSRLKAKAFFALAAGQPKAAEETIPILVYNPHPYTITAAIECEFQLSDQNLEDNFTICQVKNNSGMLPSQIEQEASHLNLDWRKKVIFNATLKPSQMNRFDCDLIKVPTRPRPELKPVNGLYSIDNGHMKVVINTRTGLLEHYEIDKKTVLARNAFRPLVMADNEDPWGMETKKFRSKAGAFKLMSAKKSAIHSGIKASSIAAVRVVEQGLVRTVIEASLQYGNSFMLLTYKIPADGTELEIEVRVTWNEKDKMLKLSLPVGFAVDQAYGQTAYGFHALPMNGNEAIVQKWLTMNSETAADTALRVIDDGIYACDIKNSELRLSLLRSAAYSGHPIQKRNIVPQDCFTARSDQGERRFRFWINGGPVAEMNKNAEQDALTKNENPVALSFFPSGHGTPVLKGPVLDGDPAIVITACKKAEDDDMLIIRLYNASAVPTKTSLSMTGANISAKKIAFTPFEVKTFKVNPKQKSLHECDMMELNL
jgi:alpha-mannosidase